MQTKQQCSSATHSRAACRDASTSLGLPSRTHQRNTFGWCSVRGKYRPGRADLSVLTQAWLEGPCNAKVFILVNYTPLKYILIGKNGRNNIHTYNYYTYYATIELKLLWNAEKYFKLRLVSSVVVIRCWCSVCGQLLPFPNICRTTTFRLTSRHLSFKNFSL